MLIPFSAFSTLFFEESKKILDLWGSEQHHPDTLIMKLNQPHSILIKQKSHKPPFLILQVTF